VDRYFHGDWLGSTRYLTDSAGNASPTAYRFDAYGNRSAQAGPDTTALKFAGRHGYQSDGPAGLQLLGARYYDPNVGRFINPDPIGFAGGMNLYAYCGDPVNAVDPSGLDWVNDAANYSAGWGDTLTFGGTKIARRAIGEAAGMGDANQAVAYSSQAYSVGQWTGIGHSMAIGGAVGAARNAALEGLRRPNPAFVYGRLRGVELVEKSHWIPNRWLQWLPSGLSSLQ